MLMKSSGKSKILTGVIIVVLLLIVAGFFYYIKTAEKKIREDVETNIVMIRNGDLSWVRLSTMPIAAELRTAMSGEQSTTESMSFMDSIIANSDIEYTLGTIKWSSCEVTYVVSGYSFADYITYCKENDICTKDAMTENFAAYMTGHEKTFHREITMTYHKTDGRWVCDYDDNSFLDAMSGGMLTAYEGYYGAAIGDVEKLISEIQSEGEENEEE